jgi:hypothetical protein
MAEATGLRVEELGLFTDLYQLTMAQSYFAQQRNQPATFSLFIALPHEVLELPDVQPLLHCVMRAGQPVEPQPTLAAARARYAEEMAYLPAPYRQVQGGEVYPVWLSAGLAARQRQVEVALQQQGYTARVVTEVKEGSCQ